MEKPDHIRKMEAARLSVAAALFLAVLKISAGVIFHSLGMLSAGVDSLMDLFASSINYFSMKESLKPADAEHTYGHGKIENVASFFQAGIIGLAGAMLIVEGVRRMLYVEELPDFDWSIAAILFSILISYLVGRRLTQVARKTDSPLLRADAMHFTVDTYTNSGVLGALVLSRWTGFIQFDRLIAIAIGAWIMVAAYGIFRSSLDALIDKDIPEEFRNHIDSIILSHSPAIIGYHNLRTRRAGSQKLIDLHLVTCREMSIAEAHDIADHIEKEIENTISHADVIIHVEPCTDNRPGCEKDCRFLHPSNRSAT
ncbi:MAG: cation diffusion facilitator family transporter [bacterium]|nr:cation diffusion facilitator family transporter [bacterium]